MSNMTAHYNSRDERGKILKHTLKQPAEIVRDCLMAAGLTPGEIDLPHDSAFPAEFIAHGEEAIVAAQKYARKYGRGIYVRGGKADVIQGV